MHMCMLGGMVSSKQQKRKMPSADTWALKDRERELELGTPYHLFIYFPHLQGSISSTILLYCAFLFQASLFFVSAEATNKDLSWCRC